MHDLEPISVQRARENAIWRAIQGRLFLLDLERKARRYRIQSRRLWWLSQERFSLAASDDAHAVERLIEASR